MGTCISKRKSNLQDPALITAPEEEKVKEVLSETPRPSIRRPKPVQKEPMVPSESDLRTVENLREADEESIDASEVTSCVSESVGVAATNDGRYVGEVQGTSRLRSRSVRLNRDQHTGRKSLSPAKRNETSPDTRTYGRVVGTSDGMRRGGSGRRSRSPADPGCRTTVNRSGSRKTTVSPRRGAIAAERKPISGDQNEVYYYGWEGRETETKKMDDGYGCNTPNETLENPLVSLECFIFL